MSFSKKEKEKICFAYMIAKGGLIKISFRFLLLTNLFVM